MKTIDKIDNLEEIANRIDGCRALIWTLYAVAENLYISPNAIGSVGDLLDAISRDFRNDLDSAEVQP